MMFLQLHKMHNTQSECEYIVWNMDGNDAPVQAHNLYHIDHTYGDVDNIMSWVRTQKRRKLVSLTFCYTLL